MTFAELDRKLTAIVADYISRGYTINAPSMESLSPGERGKVDVTNGKEIVRILIEEFSDHFDVEEADRFRNYFLSGVRLVVGRATDRIKPHTKGIDSIWNHRLDVISEEKYYRVGGYDSSWYGTREEAMRREDKHRKRIHDSYESEFVVFGDKARGIVLPFLRRQKNCKTVTAKNITRVSKRCREDGTVSYIVSSKGRDFVMNRKERFA